MYTHNTHTTEAPTFFQRVIARLNDPSPARYSGAIQLCTIGRVTLAEAPAAANSTLPTAKSQTCDSDVPCHHATPRSAA